MKKLLTLAAAMLVAAVTFGGPASAIIATHHYEVGEVQPFEGLVCRTVEPAEHIFKVWQSDGAEQARKIYQVYQAANQCRFFKAYEAYFNELLDSMEAKNFQGQMKIVLLFSISPAGDREIVDYLVTWENLDTPA